MIFNRSYNSIIVVIDNTVYEEIVFVMETHNFAEVLDILPDSYDYKIVNAEFFDDFPNGVSTVVRININSKESVLQWLKEFQQKNYITLRVLRTREENTLKICFKKEYRCIHNTLPKRGTIPHPRHTRCTAKVITTLKNQKMKRSKDIYLKTHPCEIYIRNTHNHALYSSAVLRYSSPSNDLVSPTEDPVNNDTENQLCLNETANEQNLVNVYNIKNQLRDMFTQLMDKFENAPEEYQKPISAFIRNFNSCKTDSSLKSALNTFGKYSESALPLKKRGNGTQGVRFIRIQPTALSRRNTKLKGRRVLQSGRLAETQQISDHCYSKPSNNINVCDK